MSFRTMFTGPLLGFSIATLSFGFPIHAWAHAHLLSEIPAANTKTTPAPTELRLKFSEGIELKFSKVILKGSGKTVVKTGPATLDPKDDTLLIVPLTSSLADGTYTVDWQALSTDGHKTKGTYSFDTKR